MGIQKLTSRYKMIGPLLGLGMLAGLLVVGCTRTVLPPTASIPSPQGALPFPGGGIYTPKSGLGAAGSAWRPPVATRQWKYIVLHHTATSTGSVESIHDAHLQKKDTAGKPWLGIGYHFVIGNGSGMSDGAVEPTFRWKQQLHGAHAGSENREYNQHGIGICLVGDFEKTAPSPAQRQAVKKLVQTLKTEYGISSSNVVRHGDIRQTACPGRLFPMAEVAGNDFSTGPDSPLSSGLLPQRTADTTENLLR